MVKVIFENWREGIQSVSLCKMQVEKLGLRLKEAKINVDLLLNDEKVVFEIEDEILAREFILESEKLGVTCSLTTIF